MKTYISYRPTYLNNWQGRYTLSYFLGQQYADYVSAWVTAIKDLEIPDERYTKEVVPWIKNLRRFAILEANWIDVWEFLENVKKIWATFDINDLSNIEEARQWIRDNTDLVEETPWEFILSKELIWMNREIIPKQYLIID